MKEINSHVKHFHIPSSDPLLSSSNALVLRRVAIPNCREEPLKCKNDKDFKEILMANTALRPYMRLHRDIQNKFTQPKRDINAISSAIDASRIDAHHIELCSWLAGRPTYTDFCNTNKRHITAIITRRRYSSYDCYEFFCLLCFVFFFFLFFFIEILY